MVTAMGVDSTEARHWDGVTRSSDEAFVMNVERRGYVKLFIQQ